MTDPIISHNAAERTGAGPIMSAAERETARRYRSANKQILDYVKRLGLSSDSADLLIGTVGAIMDRWLAEGSPEHFWFADDFTKQAIEKGVRKANINLARLSNKYARERSIESILYSDAYLTRIRMARLADLSHFTGLAATAKSDMAAIIAQAVADGKSVAQASADIRDRLGVSLSRAKGYAQTQLPAALRDARLAESDNAEEELDIKIGQLWTSSLLPTTRQTHAARHGRTYTSAEVKDFYGRDGNKFRCFLPDTIVSGRFVAASKIKYEGPVVKLVTASGKEITVTANHPLLTDAGMVPAYLVAKGDNLVSHSQNAGGSLFDRPCALDGQEADSRIQDVFRSFSELFHVLQHRAGAVDFHGDAVFTDKNIEVVFADRELAFASEPSVFEALDQLSFVKSNPSAFPGRSKLHLSLSRLSSFAGLVRRGSKLVLSFFGELLHSKCVSLFGLPVFNTVFIKSITNSISGDADSQGYRVNTLSGLMGRADGFNVKQVLNLVRVLRSVPGLMDSVTDSPSATAKAIGDAVNSLSGLVSFDNVVDVKVLHYKGHVYDLQERSGLMLADGVIASNCHCAVTECLLDPAGKPILSQKLKTAMSTEKTRWQG